VNKTNSLLFEKKFGFETWPQEKINKAFTFAEKYRRFISECKTEREVVSWLAGEIKKQGFAEIASKSKSKSNVYGLNRGKSIILGRFGRQPLKNGIKIILAHIDSPRIDLKPTPLYESEKMAWFKTQYYGGIKKYQWPAVPLAIHGVISLVNGRNVSLCLGEEQSDTVFTITDLLPHLSKKQMEKKMEEAVGGEEMNIIVGTVPTKTKKGKDGVKMGILELLNKKYGITEEDLVSADLEIVPAGEARNVGFDGSLIGGYGQDDRVCAYTATMALLENTNLENPSLVVLTDKEETGSESNTGAMSNFTVDFISEMLYLEEGKHDENTLRDCLTLSKAISADVTVGFDPDYKDVFDPANTARIGAGIAIEKYSGRGGKYGTNEATAEYLAQIRKVFNESHILWQTGGLGKVDEGGGGTIAMFLTRYNLDVIDAGPPILSMHSPFEISSKVDIYSCFEAYKAFFKSKFF